MLAAAGCSSPDPVEVVFFYDEICPSCEDYIRAEEIAGRVVSLGRTNRAVSAEAHNTAIPSGQSRLAEYIEKHRLPDVSASAPLLFVDEEYTVGYEEIEAEVSRLLDRGLSER
jgi:hypothetical protein